MTEKTNDQAEIDKDKILTTEARRTVFAGLVAGLTKKEAAAKAGLSYQTVRDLATKYDINALVRQERAKIEKKTQKKLEITHEGQARKYEAVIRGATEDRTWSAVNQAIKGQNTLCGLEREGDQVAVVVDRTLSKREMARLLRDDIIDCDDAIAE